ncbi:hypothetical protein [Marinimicrobium alkaliphilum]|uniref:hypothetical protein n=1 Tax=Marinimicrobium alkaliphilum TaxID=2202654 RepID=UPI000DBA88B1|nr:hypothetical protein [Marinimicrobium alkaliphilum]
MRLFHALTGAFSLLLLAGCATKLSPLQEDALHPLTDKSGLLVLAVDSNISLYELRITGNRTLLFNKDDLTRGTHYLLVEVPAGQYRIANIGLSANITVRLDFDRDLWRFEVQPGTINYVGHLRMNNRHLLGSDILLTNNASLALEHLEEHFPLLLSSHAINYSGPGEDNFFQIVGAGKEAP